MAKQDVEHAISESSRAFSGPVRAYLEGIAFSASECGLSEERVILNVQETVKIALRYRGRELEALEVIAETYDSARRNGQSHLRRTARDPLLGEPIYEVVERGRRYKGVDSTHITSLGSTFRRILLDSRTKMKKAPRRAKSSNKGGRTHSQREANKSIQ